VEDYHVDRLGVEVQQCMKLTSTNSPIGLIVLIAYVHRTKFDALLGLALTRSGAPGGPRHKARRPLACMGRPTQALQTKKTCSKNKTK
jgi:hypothetical protein